MRTFHCFVKGFFERLQPRIIGIAVVGLGILLPAAGWAQGDVPGRPCNPNQPGACFAPQPFQTGTILDGDFEVLAAFLEGENDFVQLLPNGTFRVHNSDNAALLGYCPTAVVLAGECMPGSPAVWLGDGRVSGNAVVPPEGGVLCPGVLHIRGQVVDPQTGDLFDVEGSLLSVRKADAPEDCDVTQEVNAEPS